MNDIDITDQVLGIGTGKTVEIWDHAVVAAAFLKDAIIHGDVPDIEICSTGEKYIVVADS